MRSVCASTVPAVRLIVVPVFVVLLGFAPVLRATVLLPAEFREIVAGSQLIAHGHVLDAVPELSGDRKRIDTVITFAVSTYLKGSAGDTLTFRVPGGQIGRYRSVTVGAPVFESGDEAVLFLRRPEGGAPHVFGLNQGVFRVQREPRTERRMVMPPLMSRGDAPEAVARGARSRRPMPLEAFGAQVKTVLSELADDGR